MPTIKQFRPRLYWLVFLGFTGFGLASEGPMLWLVASFALGINAWLVATRRFRPMPRTLANVGSLGMTGLAGWYVVSAARTQSIAPVITIGQFLVLLQLVKLYEQRANRDYAQLMVLSLLLMIAAAISTASLLFGIVFLVYLIVALYCYLLYHLKVETDAVRETQQFAPAVITLGNDLSSLRIFHTSVRRALALLGVVGLGVSLAVFIFFPRQAAEGVLGRRALAGGAALSGFNDAVSFEEVARIDQNDDIVAQVQVTKLGQPWNGGSLLLRGNTLDNYTGQSGYIQRIRPPGMGIPPYNIGRWHWVRSEDQDANDAIDESPSGRVRQFIDGDNGFMQDITLQPTRTRTVFAMPGVYAMQTNRDVTLIYGRRDAIVRTMDQSQLQASAHYKAWSSGTLPVVHETSIGVGSQIDPQIAVYARRPDVSGTEANGVTLAQLRGATVTTSQYDHRIASSIERHLRTQFEYTLDLTADRDLLQSDTDPVVSFLYTIKKGHCEFFASAMTLMCQSLGMKARMVVGFRSDEYNPIGNFYIVRQSHAHAWVEVLTPGGWETFDPTSSNEATTTADVNMFSAIKNLYGFLEYKWGTDVVAYGQGNEQHAVEAISDAVTTTAFRGGQQFLRLQSWMDNAAAAIKTSYVKVVAWMIGAGAVGYFLYIQLKLRRRALRIGLDGLPIDTRQKLARQLGFYDDLLRDLERHGIRRPANLTPMEFSEQLSYLPLNIFDDIRRLTGVFYRVRFGRAELNKSKQRRLAGVVSRVQSRLSGAFSTPS